MFKNVEKKGINHKKCQKIIKNIKKLGTTVKKVENDQNY